MIASQEFYHNPKTYVSTQLWKVKCKKDILKDSVDRLKLMVNAQLDFIAQNLEIKKEEESLRKYKEKCLGHMESGLNILEMEH